MAQSSAYFQKAMLDWCLEGLDMTCLKRKPGKYRPQLPPGMDATQTYKYIYHITKQIEAGTATPQQWRFLNQYADPKMVEELRKMALLRAAGIPHKNPLDRK